VYFYVYFLKAIMKIDNTPVTGIILETRKSNADELHPVKLRITFKGDRKYYTLKGLDKKTLYMSSDDFHRISTSTNLKPLKIHLTEIEKKAMKVIEEMAVFSFESFESIYFSKPKDDKDLFSILDATGKKMREAGRISTAVSFECALKSLKEFTGKEKFPFAAANVKFFKDYEKWMLTPKVIEWKTKTGKSKSRTKVNGRTTVGIYLRNVRTMFNQVKPVGVLYPFGKSNQGLYAIPKGKNVKKALTQADVAKIASYSAAKGTLELQCRDYWLFSYLCNGINIKDMARLKYSNIKGEKITLIRAKTAESVDEETTIDIMITKQIGRIIDLHGNKPGTSDQYIFPILYQGITPEDEYRLIQQTVRNINDNMTNICKELKIDRATTYTARHSFATVLKRSGASVEFISESLGHKSKQTTQNYLANFEDEEKKKWANMLLPENEV